MSFWDIVWFIIISFAFIAYLMILFSIFGDLFRDRDTSGLAKGAWVVALILLPFLSALVYLIARGGGMAERSMAAAQAMQEQQEAYIKQVATPASPADQIAQATRMLEEGTITEADYERLKAKALS
jgi:hypothetical protein